jgi:anti-sigma regulatory factor (Ser/Thr protein kinase)
MEASTSPPDSAQWPKAASAELVVKNDVSAIRAARNFARQVAGGLGANTDDTVELLVAELVTNAVLHGAPPVTIRIESRPERVHIGVTDASPRLPIARLPQAGSISGRGLQIVGALSAGWGVVPRPEGGKVVWADVTARPGAPVGEPRAR